MLLLCCCVIPCSSLLLRTLLHYISRATSWSLTNKRGFLSLSLFSPFSIHKTFYTSRDRLHGNLGNKNNEWNFEHKFFNLACSFGLVRLPVGWWLCCDGNELSLSWVKSVCVNVCEFSVICTLFMHACMKFWDVCNVRTPSSIAASTYANLLVSVINHWLHQSVKWVGCVM